MAYLIIAAEYFAVASPVLLIIGGLSSLISDFRFKKSLK